MEVNNGYTFIRPYDEQTNAAWEHDAGGSTTRNMNTTNSGLITLTLAPHAVPDAVPDE